MSTLDIQALAELQRDVDGFRGRFRFIEEHSCKNCEAGDGVVSALVFVEDGEVEEDCSAWTIIAEGIDNHVAEPMARMLNATGPLLGMIKL